MKIKYFLLFSLLLVSLGSTTQIKKQKLANSVWLITKIVHDSATYDYKAIIDPAFMIEFGKIQKKKGIGITGDFSIRCQSNQGNCPENATPLQGHCFFSTVNDSAIEMGFADHSTYNPSLDKSKYGKLLRAAFEGYGVYYVNKNTMVIKDTKSRFKGNKIFLMRLE